MRIVVPVFFLLLVASCGIFKKKKASDDKHTKKHEPVEKTDAVIDEIIATNGGLGNLLIKDELDDGKLNSNINLIKSKVDASFFGFDGGGKARLYSYKNEPVFAILKKENQKIKAIIAIHPDIKTNKSISVQSSLKKIKATYPDGKLIDDQMNKWSIYEIQAKKWQFTFDARLGEINGDERSQFLIIR